MNLRTGTLLSGVVGGAAWLARWVLDLAGADDGAGHVLYWTGLVLIAVALAAFGAGLVSRSEIWLRVIVAVAFPLLVWSVLEVMDPGTGVAPTDGLLGLIVAATSALSLREERGAQVQPHHRGAHLR